MIDPKLLEYCETDYQTDVIKRSIEGASQREIATALGRSRSSIQDTITRIKANATRKGYAPEQDLNYPIAEGMSIKGVSDFVDGDGNVMRRWIKTDRDKEEQEEQFKIFLESFTSTLQSYKPIKKVKQRRKFQRDTLTVYPMGDPHIGMYAWADETGNDFDCDIAEKQLREAMGYLVEKTPDSETAIILNLGDFFHSDSSRNTTTKGTAVDLDTRWSRVLQIGITLMVDCVNLALEKHKKVIVRNNPGNHDKETAIVLSVAMMWAFHNNPRVEIWQPEKPIFFYEFGNCSLFSAHGDMVKPKKMQGTISNYYPEIWGRTEHRYALFGHFHHEERFEDNGLITEIFNTLAASDAWHHASGYKSKRNMKALVLDRNEGETERYTFSLPRNKIL